MGSKGFMQQFCAFGLYFVVLMMVHQRCSASTFGDACTSDSDCSTYDQTCVSSACACRPGFYKYGSSKLCTVSEPVQNLTAEWGGSISVNGGEEIDQYYAEWNPPMKTGSNADMNVTAYVMRVWDGDSCLYRKIAPCLNCAQDPVLKNGNCASSSNFDSFVLKNKDYMEQMRLKVPDLPYYKNVTISVSAVKNGYEGIPETFVLETKSQVPLKFKSVNVEKLRNLTADTVSLNVSWVPGDYRGPYSPHVRYQRQSKPSINTVIMFNADVSFTVLKNLSAGENYTIEVYGNCLYCEVDDFETSAGPKSEMIVRTLSLPPGQVKDLQVSQDYSWADRLEVSFECPEEPNGLLQGFLIVKKQDNNEESFFVPREDKSCSFKVGKEVIGPAKVAKPYSFKVMTVGEEFNSSFSNMVQITPLAREPYLYDPSKQGEVLNVASSSENSMKISLCSNCIVNDTQGEVLEVGILVCRVNFCDELDRITQRKIKTLSNLTVTTWANAKEADFSKPYWATSLNLTQVLKQAGAENYYITIGAESDCSSNTNVVEYCNGPLPTEQNYRVGVVVCNAAGCAESSIYQELTEDGLTGGQIAGIVIGVIGGVILITVIIFIIMKKMRD